MQKINQTQNTPQREESVMHRNNSFLLDFYELTMANNYFNNGRANEKAVFDYYFRKIPDKGGYAIFCGLEILLGFVKSWHFDEEQIEFLRNKGGFSPEFLQYLKNFRFTGEIYAFPEGSVVFPNEPIISVRASLIECQLLETFLLVTINHNSLIATKSSRMCHEAQGRPIFEFGTRRAHGGSSAVYGARAAYIGGVDATACVEAEFRYKVPAVGTMAHSFIQSYEDEYEAFLSFAKSYPDNCNLLIDTYDVLNSGLPNAIRVHKEFLQPNGYYLKGVRIDSGDLAYLSNRVRTTLDNNGLEQTKIIASNSLDEFVIKDLLSQEAKIDGFGIGERLITAKSDAVFGGVYKIVALEKEGKEIPKIKISENLDKTTTPAFKQVYRLYDEDGMAIADVVTLRNEVIKEDEPYYIFSPLATWKRKVLINFHARPLLNLVWKDGKLADELYPSIMQMREFVKRELKTFWPEIKRLTNPHNYYVDLSKDLFELKQNMILDIKGREQF